MWAPSTWIVQLWPLKFTMWSTDRGSQTVWWPCVWTTHTFFTHVCTGDRKQLQTLRYTVLIILPHSYWTHIKIRRGICCCKFTYVLCSHRKTVLTFQFIWYWDKLIITLPTIYSELCCQEVSELQTPAYQFFGCPERQCYVRDASEVRPGETLHHGGRWAIYCYGNRTDRAPCHHVWTQPVPRQGHCWRPFENCWRDKVRPDDTYFCNYTN